MTQEERLVRSILLHFGGYRAASKVLGVPDPTVYRWVRNAAIPPWRREEILELLLKMKKDIQEKEKLYLLSKDRKPDLSPIIKPKLPTKTNGNKKSREFMKIISFWAPVAVWERFRHLATDERTTMDALLNEAATDFLAKRGR